MNISISNFKAINKGGLKASFAVNFNDCVTLYNCTLFYSEKNDNYFIGVYQREFNNKKFDIVYISPSLKDKITQAAVDEYENTKEPINLLRK